MSLFPISAYAADENSDYSDVSYLDAEGKENKALIEVTESGEIIVEYYIDGVWLNTARVVIADEYLFYSLETSDSESVETFVEPLTNYIGVSDADILMEEPNEIQVTASEYVKMGTVAFTSHTVGSALGNVHKHSLDFYRMFRDEVMDYRTFNGPSGAAVSAVIGVVVGILVAINTVLSSAAEAIFWTAVTSLGASVVGGILQDTIVGHFYCQSKYYFIKVVDPDSGKICYYSGDEYRILLANNVWDDTIHKTGYLEWDNSNTLSLV